MACLTVGSRYFRGLSSTLFSSFNGGTCCGVRAKKLDSKEFMWWHRPGVPKVEVAQPVPEKGRKTWWTLPSLLCRVWEQGCCPMKTKKSYNHLH